MDPISNKKEFNDLTVNLRDLAYSYLEFFDIRSFFQKANF